MKTLNPCAWLRRVLYPATPEGRRNYVQDSFQDDPLRTYRIKERVYFALICIICTGLLIVVYFIITSEA